LLAPAKINLTLEVLSRRPDGLHQLRSVMVPLALFDRITVQAAPATSLACDEQELESDNIVLRALDAAGCAPVRLTLEKRIPFGGGLGGGSSDAAAVLRAAMEGTIPRLGDPPDWLSVARDLGSDVPFFLVGTGALVEGTGERVTALGALPPWWCVVAEPSVRVATADAYRLLDEMREREAPASRSRARSVSLRAVEALQRSDFHALQDALANDFHDAVLAAFPLVATARDALVAAGVERPLLSGSGSCLFALFEEESDARAVVARVNGPSVRRTFVAAFHCDARWRTAS